MQSRVPGIIATQYLMMIMIVQRLFLSMPTLNLELDCNYLNVDLHLLFGSSHKVNIIIHQAHGMDP